MKRLIPKCLNGTTGKEILRLTREIENKQKAKQNSPLTFADIASSAASLHPMIGTYLGALDLGYDTNRFIHNPH